MKRFLTAQLVALALVLLGTTGLRATPLPPAQVSWSYNFAPSAPALFADSNPGAGVTLTNEPSRNAVGDSDIVATNIRVFSAAVAASPDTITGANGNYGLALNLTTVEDAIPHSGTLTFSGTVSGTFSSENAGLANAYSTASQTLTLGSYNFTVALIAYTPPGPPDQANAGSIAAHVTISAVTPAEKFPEPSSMLLSGLGLTFLGGAAWRKRRKAQKS